MVKRKQVPKSKYRQYRTRSRAVRLQTNPKSNQNWLVIGTVVAVIVVATALWLINRPTREKQGTRPLAELPVAERVDYFDAQPEMMIDPSRDYQALIVTEKGEITLDLFEQESPVTVNNFAFLSRQGFYDGLTFHRVIDGFMAQAGDPSGTGGGGPGYRFDDETDNGLAFDRLGQLAMANAGPNTNGSQFFITFIPTPHLDGLHTIFGEVIEGADVLDRLTRRDPQSSPEFTGDVIETIVILEDGQPS